MQEKCTYFPDRGCIHTLLTLCAYTTALILLTIITAQMMSIGGEGDITMGKALHHGKRSMVIVVG